MKRIILCVSLLASAIALSAQEIIVYRLGTTTSNPGYSVPMHIRTSFQTTHPDVTVVTWEPLSDWWVASYTEDNRIYHVYFNPAGVNFNVALPVMQTYVPDAVITTAISKYGNALYDITRMKGASNQEVYQVRLLENGISRSVWLDANGTEVTDVFTVHTQDDMKLKADDGEMKIKMEKDEQKIKNDPK